MDFSVIGKGIGNELGWRSFVSMRVVASVGTFSGSKWGRSGAVARRRSRKAAESQGGGRRRSRTKTPTDFIKATKTIHCRTPQKTAHCALEWRRHARAKYNSSEPTATTPVIAIRTRARATTKRERLIERTEEGLEEGALSTNTHKQGRRPIAGYKQFPERKRRNASARKRRRETE